MSFAETQIDLVKLADGSRLLRLSDAASLLCLEKRLDPSDSVLRQKQHWLHVFRNLLVSEATASAA
jgi:hypothetical protein